MPDEMERGQREKGQAKGQQQKGQQLPVNVVLTIEQKAGPQ